MLKCKQYEKLLEPLEFSGCGGEALLKLQKTEETGKQNLYDPLS